MTGRPLGVVALAACAALAAAWMQTADLTVPVPAGASVGVSSGAGAARQDAPGNRDGRGNVPDHDGLQEAVQQALAKAVARPDIGFALGSAQAVRLDDDGSRIEGHGIALWADGEPRYVSFMLRVSADGRTVAFDFGVQDPGGPAGLLADN